MILEYYENTYVNKIYIFKVKRTHVFKNMNFKNTLEETEYLNRPMSINDIKYVPKSFHKKNSKQSFPDR